MPELPEVEVVRRGLLPYVTGRTITGVEVFDARTARRQAGGPEMLVEHLTGARIGALARRGKFLWWRLQDPDGQDTGHALVTHLGMSGQLRARVAAQVSVAGTDGAVGQEGPAPDPQRHLRIRLHLDDGADIDFLDQRLFGGLWTSPLEPAADGLLAGEGSPDALLPRSAAHIARDVLDPAVDLPALARLLRTRSAPIKSLLLSQDIVSGIGNIYADEALWVARARHDTPARELSQVRARRLLEACRAVMNRALEVGGTSFDALYVNVDGRSGYFARSLSAYGQEGRPCPRCGTMIRREQRQGRSCFFCPRCQPRHPGSRPAADDRTIRPRDRKVHP